MIKITKSPQGQGIKKSDVSPIVSKKEMASSGGHHDKLKNSPKTKTVSAVMSDTNSNTGPKTQSHSTPLKQSQSGSPSLKQPHSHSPRKTRMSKTEDKTDDVKVALGKQQFALNLPKLNVPPEEKGDLVYKNTKNKNHDLSDIVKVENKELYRQRGKLRPLRKSSHSSNLDLIEMEEGETTEQSTEEEYDLEELYEIGNDKNDNRHGRKASKEDVVHCACGDNADEGFMIQVSINIVGVAGHVSGCGWVTSIVFVHFVCLLFLV